MRIVRKMFWCIFFSIGACWGREQQQYVWADNVNCYVKALIQGSYKDAPSSKFKGVIIWATEHPKSQRFLVFKSGKQLFVSPKHCLDRYVATSDTSLIELEEIEEQERYDRINKIETRMLDRIETSEQKYYLEFRAGTFFGFDDSLALDDASYSDQINRLDSPGNDYEYLSGGKSKDTKSSINLGLEFGFKANESIYFTVGYSRNKRERTEELVVTLNGDRTNGLAEIVEDYSALSFGGKFLFGDKLGMRPLLHPRIQLVSIKQDFGGVVFEGASVALSLDVGGEYLLTRNIAFSLRGGYDYHPQAKFKLKGGEESSTSYAGYKSNYNYSVFSANLGLIYYFR